MNTSPPAARLRYCARRASLVLHWNKTRAPVDRRRIYTAQDTATTDATSKHAVSAASVAQQLRGKRREGMGDSRVQGQGPDKGSGGRSRPKIEAFLLPARHYASAGTSNGPVFVYVCLSVCVCHKSVSYNVTQFAQGSIRDFCLEGGQAEIRFIGRTHAQVHLKLIHTATPDTTKSV